MRTVYLREIAISETSDAAFRRRFIYVQGRLWNPPMGGIWVGAPVEFHGRAGTIVSCQTHLDLHGDLEVDLSMRFLSSDIPSVDDLAFPMMSALNGNPILRNIGHVNYNELILMDAVGERHESSSEYETSGSSSSSEEESTGWSEWEARSWEESSSHDSPVPCLQTKERTKREAIVPSPIENAIDLLEL